MYKNLSVLGTIIFGFGTGICGVFASPSELPNSILQLLPLIENHFQVEQNSISIPLPFEFLNKTLQSYCPSSGIASAKNKLNMILAEREDAILKKRNLLQLTRDFSQLKKLYLAIKTEDEADFCEQKSLLLPILQKTQEAFISNQASSSKSSRKPALLRQTERLKDSDTNSKEQEQSSRKQEEEQGHGAAERDPINIMHHTQYLAPQQLKVKSQAEYFMQSILQDMQSKNILLAKDMKNLDGKIEIHYLQACKASKGSFHLLTDPQRRNHIFKAIKLQLHLCNKLPSTQQLWKHIQHLLAHELGHYISFFREKDASNFWKICRKGKANICNYKDFNSQYAQTNVDEDYAESFAYRYRYSQDRKSHPAAGSEKLQQKEEYFDKLFSQSP